MPILAHNYQRQLNDRQNQLSYSVHGRIGRQQELRLVDLEMVRYESRRITAVSPNPDLL